MDTRLIYAFLLCIGYAMIACSRDEYAEDMPLLEQLPASQTHISFANQLREDSYLNIITYEYFYNGGGVAVGDVNQDGLTDVFFTGNMVSNALYLNKSDFRFEDVSETARLSTRGQWANGAAMVDINNDGWLDIYVCMGGPYREPARRKNHLYINQKDGTFKEEAEKYGLADTGYSIQAYFFDYDQDGLLDMYLVSNCFLDQGPNIIRPKISDGTAENNDRLYRNNGIGPDGHPTFTEVTQEAGIVWEGNGLGASVCDINGDLWPDIYVSNDYLSNDLLYINNGDGPDGYPTFTNRIEDYFKHQSYSAMGNDVADFNNDGLTDIFTLDMLPPDNYRQKMMFGATNYDRYLSEIEAGYSPQFMRNTLQLNNGMGSDGHPRGGHPAFSEIGRLAGVNSTDWSWACLFADLDNDGWKDIIVTNGYPKDITNRDFATFKMQQYRRGTSQQAFMAQLVDALQEVEGVHLPNFVFQNKGATSGQALQFTDQSDAWGFTMPSYSHGMATADLDNDGDLDIVINNLNREAFVYRNHAREQSENGYLRVAFAPSVAPADQIGTKLTLFHDGKVQYQEYSPYRGYLSSVAPSMHFGVGSATHLDSLVVVWPDGSQQVEKDITLNQSLQLSKNAIPASRSNKNPSIFLQKEGFIPDNGQQTWFKEVTPAVSLAHRHREKDYADFKVQPLLPHKFSQAGPGIAAGDINGDGREDVVIGGTFQQKNMLFLQDEKGSFHAHPMAADAGTEEVLGVLLFDADNDQDLDLYTVSGGYEFPQNSEFYQDHLYLNDGKGNFQLTNDALPQIQSSGSCVKAADYDRDGDLDLFVGGLVVPGRYPEPSRSYVLENQGGKFMDVTEQVSEKLMHPGLVKDALWTDFNGDGWTDLIIAGEWMPLQFYENREGKLVDVTQNTGLTGTEGWWNSLVGGDFDNDGDTDYTAGNQGWNARYQPTPQQPLQIYAHDFDQNGSMDPVITYTMPEGTYPVHPLDDMIQQMSFIKGKFPRYADYAQATIIDVFSPEALQQALTMQAVNFSSVYIENQGGGKFRLQPLPVRAQFAPLFGMIARDVNGDGNLDLLFCGNSYAPEVLSGRQDASLGGLLLGDGEGNFEFVSPQESGISIDGDAKGFITTMNAKGEELILTTQNKGPVKIFSSGRAAILKAASDDSWAEIHLANEKTRRQELYHGHSYLSASSRYLTITPDMVEVIMHTYSGATRQITLPDTRQNNGI